jgi:hypothetical protein
MTDESTNLERRIAEETRQALTANCNEARDAHVSLLKLYRARLENEREVQYRSLRNRTAREWKPDTPQRAAGGRTSVWL